MFQGHHIVVDGIAGRSLLDKTLEAYLAMEAQRPPEKYSDRYPQYIVEHNNKMDKPLAENFWREELAAVEPLDFSKPPMFPDDQQYHVLTHLLSEEKGKLIKQYCRQQRIHPSIYFRFLSAVLLTQYCRAENDFVVYEIQSGRGAGHEDAIGVYYQQVPFHYEKKLFDKDSVPTDFYQQQKVYRKKIRGHLDVSLALQDAIVGNGRIGFQYNYFNFLQEATFGDLAAIPDVQSSHVEDTVQVFIKETGSTFSLELWFDGKVFMPLDFLPRLEQISDQLCQGQVSKVGDFNLVLANEAKRYQEWNLTEQLLPEFETVVHWFESQVVQSPELPAVICGSDCLTYQQLNVQANQLAHWLINSGVKPGDFVAICLERSVNMLVALWGVLKAGASYVPIEVTYPIERIRYMLEDSGASALLTEICLQDKFADYSGAQLVLDGAEEVLAKQDKENPALPISADDGIYIIYTSGSTGQPKGAQVHHRGELNLQQWYINRNGLTGEDRVLIISAFGFDLTQKNFYAPLLVGGCIVIPDVKGYDPVAFRTLIDDQQITLLNCAPSAFYPIVESIPESERQTPSSLSSLRAVWLGGEPIRMEALVSWYRTNDTVLVNSYGPTECTDVVAAYDIPKDYQSTDVIPIGHAIDNSQIFILSDNEQLCPPGIIGEICITGVCVGNGYLNKSELTEDVFVDHSIAGGSTKLYKTGDLGRYLPTGDIEYIGRKDFQVKLRGLRIELGEIEYALCQLPGVKDGLVLVKSLGDQSDAAEQLIAYAVIEDSFSVPDWREKLADYLPDYMVPGYLVTLTQWPLTPNGKIDRKALPEPDLNQRRVPYVAPRNDLEATIAGIWSQVLNVDQVGVNDNFFDLGGHSLLATQIASRIRRDLAINLQIRDLLGEPSVAAIAELLASMDAKKDTRPPIKALNLERDIPLSLGQQRLWFFEQMNPGTVANNMPAAIRLRGDLSIAALKAAFMEVSHRHHALRSAFYLGEDGQPKQQIKSDIGPLIEVVDLTHVENKDIDKEVMNRVATDRATAFDLSEGPLLRAQLLCLTQANPTKEVKAEWVLLLCMHHIISDGFSINILLNELTTLYYVFANQMPSPLPALPVQYTDFAVWQRTHLQGDLLDQQLAYWDAKLAKAPKLSTFPTDKPRPSVQTTNGTNLNFAFSEGFADKLALYCRETGLTPFMFTFCVWSLLLARYSGQRDLCIGIPTAGRHVPELENLIGFFINSMVLRPNLKGNPSASELLQRTKDLVLDGFANADVPIEMVLERLPLERNPAYTPLVQTAFQLLVNEQQATSDNLAQTFAGLEVEAIQGGGVSAKFDMLLTLNMTQGQLQGTLEYNTDLYLPDTAQRVVNQFMGLANDILENDSHSINNYELYSDAELFTALNLDPQTYDQILPLTTTQEAFLLNLQLNPNTVQYSVGYSYEIFKPLDLKLWQQAMERVMQQSVIMRAEFHLCDVDGAKIAYQAIRKQRREIVQHCDVLSEFDGNPKPSRDQVVRWIEDWVYQPFDVHHDELVNYRLLKLADDHYQFACRVHHIAMDGIAGRSSLDKILATYAALENDEPAPAYDDQFVEYVYQHVDEIDRPHVEAFWRDELKDAEPLDFSKPPVFFDDNQYHVIKHGIDAEKTKQIKQYCRKQRLHPSIYFRYLSMVLLHTYCRAESDFVVYEIGGGRSAGHEDSIGVYYQQVPYHYEKALFEGSATPKDFYNQQKQYRKKLKGNTSISLQLQDAIIGSGRIGFQYNYFNFLQVIPFGESAAMLEMQSSHVENTVQVFIKEFDDTFSLELWYDGRVFNPLDFLPRMEKLSDQLSSLDVQHVADFEFLLNQEKTIYAEWNSQTSDLPDYSSIVAWFEAQAAATPMAIAVVCGNDSLDYLALNHKANQLAHWLRSKNIGSSDFVGICLNRSVDMLVAILGVIKTGAAYLPIEAGYPKDRISYMLSDSQAKVLLTQADLTDRLTDSDYSGELLLVDQHQDMLSQQINDNLNIVINPNDTLYMIYTSGSTGKPKGAQVTHLGELNLQNWYINRNGLRPTDRLLVMSAFGFDLTQKNFFAPLLSGGSVVLPDTEGYDPVTFTQLIAAEKITLLNCAPSAFYPMIEHCVGDYQALSSLRSVWLGGEPIRMDALMDWYQTSNTVLVNSYGPTECTDVVAAYDVPKDYQAGDVLPIGGAIENTQLFIVNGNQQICPPGIVGEICISGHCVGKGYLGKDELTQEVFTDNRFGEGMLYHTGDLGRYLPTGDIEYIGRKDFQVKLRGLRIELGEIETALKSIADIDDALVLVHDDVLVAYTLVAHSGLEYAGVENDFDVSDWRVILRDKLPDYMVPNHIITLEAWPLTPNGKVDRKALPKPTAGSRSVEFIAPRNAIEKTLQQIWMAVLELDQIGVKDNFFEIGGHSILGVRIIARVDQELGVNLQAVDLLNCQTIEKLAEKIQEKGVGDAFNPLVTLKNNNAERNLFFIHPIGGDVLCYRELSERLNDSVNVFGLRCRGLDIKDPIYNSLDEMVSDYVEAVLAVQSSGEIFLAGQSLGGVLCIEVAKELALRGVNTSRLFMLDTYAPDHLHQYFGDEVDMIQAALGIEFPPQVHELKQKNPEQWLLMLYNMMKSFGVLTDDVTFERVTAIYQVVVNNFSFSATYAIDWNALPVIAHFSALDSHNRVKASESWQTAHGYQSQQFNWFDSAGDHESIMQKENVAELAQKINQMLN
ncbi:MAG: amino acid adenylation domain-containing protein [Pseudomonadales bacterium]|nr:amino acid adenylation domain-containing protein [Pseudomonadales bacterium]